MICNFFKYPLYYIVWRVFFCKETPLDRFQIVYVTKKVTKQILKMYFVLKEGSKKMNDIEKYEKLKQQRLERQFEKTFEDIEWEKKLSSDCLGDIFADYTKEDLKEIVKQKGLTNVSKCKKQALIRRLVEYMLQKDVMRHYFLYLQDGEIKEFENALNANGLYVPQDLMNIAMLEESCYIGVLEDDRILVPNDVAKVYRSFCDEEFEAERKKVSYVMCCCDTANILYGITPFSILVKLIEKNSEIQVTEEEIRTIIEQMPTELKDFMFVGDTLYLGDLYFDDRGLLEAQEGIEFYIPTLAEIIEFGTKGYCSTSREVLKLKKFLMRKAEVLPEEAEILCGISQMRIMQGCEIDDVLDVFEDFEIEFEFEHHVEQFSRYFVELWNGTRMVVNRGFTPKELDVEEPVEHVEKKSNVIDISEIRKNKK